jgi:hypothetical protein
LIFSFLKIYAFANLFTYKEIARAENMPRANTIKIKVPLEGAKMGRRKQLYKCDLPPQK